MFRAKGGQNKLRKEKNLIWRRAFRSRALIKDRRKVRDRFRRSHSLILCEWGASGRGRRRRHSAQQLLKQNICTKPASTTKQAWRQTNKHSRNTRKPLTPVKYAAYHVQLFIIGLGEINGRGHQDQWVQDTLFAAFGVHIHHLLESFGVVNNVLRYSLQNPRTVNANIDISEFEQF